MIRCLFIILTWISITIADDWSSQCNKCKCTWSDGRKKANCKNTNLITIPDDLSPELRDVDLSSNMFYELRSYAFASVNLQDVHKLKLRNCSLQKIDKFSFAKLALLIELDLSQNEISDLDQETFKDNQKLRTLYLNHNNLRYLNGTVFHSLKSLQRFEVNNNKIVTVDPYIFENGPALQYVDLSSNQLKYLDAQLLVNLKRIISFNVQSNPWVCDCRLKKFRDFVIEANLVTAPTVCAEPPRLKNQLWSQLESNDFACSPRILQIFSSIAQGEESSNISAFCKVSGDPDPDINWIVNGRVIDLESQQKKYHIIKEKKESFFWNNLTVLKFDYGDRGEYRCVAKNVAGMHEKNVDLFPESGFYDNNSTGLSSSSNSFHLAIGLSIAIVVLVILTAILIFYCVKNSRRSKSKINSMNQSADYVTLPARQEMEKSLITEVNPVTKPPRQYSTPLLDGSVELDIKTNLLENDMNYGIDDESHSFDFEQPTHSKSQNLSTVVPINQQLPPDLLSFSHRNIQISPTTSSVSMIPDQVNQQQCYGLPVANLRSPMYDTYSLCRTLPYSRSHSPFISPMLPTYPSGYVTIPRRPRASWSSEPPGHMSIIADPIYDNLGERTTAAGNSRVSLDHLNETPKPVNNRPLSRALPFGPVPEQKNSMTSGIATLPRKHLSPKTFSSENHKPTVLNRSVAENNKAPYEPMIAESNADSPKDNGTKITKIPPRPPPKPKKRTSTGPLFEDEGEDGTEV